MTAAPISRVHLVERAMQALGERGALQLRPPPRSTASARHPDEVTAPPAIFRDTEAAVPHGPAPEPARPALGVELNALRRAGLVTLPEGGRGRIHEEIDVVQHGILRAIRAAGAESGRAELVLVTSARPGEGKTFTALNVAANLAAGGSQPVVLVDADGKQDSLSRHLGLADRAGLRSLAEDPSLPPAGFLVGTELGQLMLLPYGPPASDGAGAPPGAAVQAAILRLATALPGRIILLDVPPCLSTSDASSLAPIVGQVVLVVEAERTRRNEVEAALDMVEACPTLQLLLNKSRLTASDTFGAYAKG